jgi:outer membrane protein assembly factor BamB
VFPPEEKLFTATPVFDPPGGVFAAPTTALITCATEGADIYYTTDGSSPSDTHGTLYASPVQVSHSMTIKAGAYAEGRLPSIVGEAIFTISGNVPPAITAATVTGSPRPGQVCRITVSCTATDADGYIASVAADLSSLGGLVNQNLSRGQNDTWSWSGSVRPTSAGTKQVPITATDDQGSVATVAVTVEAYTPPGQAKWSYSTLGPILCSPAVGQDGTIYVGSSDKNLYAIHPDASLKWTYRASAMVTSCPAVGADGAVYFGAASALLAVNPDGSLRWSAPAPGAIHGSAAIGTGGTVYVGATDGTILAVNPNGTVRWQFTTGGSIESSPAISPEGTLYVGSFDGRLYALWLNGGQKWSFLTGGPIISSPAIGKDGTVYVGSTDGKIYAINPNGTRRWDSARGGAVRSSPAIGDDGVLYIGADNGSLAALDAATGQLRWEYLAPAAIQSSPALADDGTVYVGCNDGNVYALGGQGHEMWHFTTGAEVGSSPVVTADGTVYVGSADMRLYAIAGVPGPAAGPWPVYRANARRTGAAPGLPSGNLPPRISALAATGVLIQGRPSALNVLCTALDPDVGLASVVADLSAVGGAAAQGLTKGTGDDWTWSGTPTPPSYGFQSIQFAATDTDGAAVTATTSIRVMAPPQVAGASVTSPLVRQQSATVTASCEVSDADGVILSVVADLSAIGGAKTQALSHAAGNAWTWSGDLTPPTMGSQTVTITAVDNEAVTTTADVLVTVENDLPGVTDMVVTGLMGQGYPSSASVSCQAYDPDGTVVSVTVDLSAIGGSASQPLTLNAGQWEWSGTFTAPAAGSFVVAFTATDNDGGQTTGTITVAIYPRITNLSVSSAVPLVANQSATITVGCTAMNPDATIQSVVADLSWLGGSNSQPLAQGAGDTWSWTGDVLPTGLGDMLVTFTAVDADGRIARAQITVSTSQIAPLVSNVTLSGFLQAGLACPVTVSCLATDDGTVTAVAADLSAIGGPASAALTHQAVQWSWSGTVTPGSAGNKTITITATDDVGLTGSASATVLVNASGKWTPLPLGGAVESSPAIAADGTIYVGSADYNLYAVNSNGTVKWTRSLSGNVQSSPAIGPDGTIYVGSGDKKLYAVRPDNTVLWAFATGARVFSSPAISADGSTVYVGSDDNKLYAVTAATGASAWAAPFAAADRIPSSPAIAADGTIYVGSWDKSLYAVNPNGSKKWSLVTAGPINASPAIAADGTVYIGSSGAASVPATLYAVNPATGLANWSFPLGGLYVYSSPAVAPDGTIYIGAESDGGKLYAINPGGTKKWECLLDGLVRSSPAVGSDGVVYVGTNAGTVYAISASGSVTWTYHALAEVRSSPVLAPDGTLYVGSYDWNLYAITASGTLATSPWPMFRGGPLHTGRGNGQ